MTSPGFYICFQRSKKRCLKFGNIFLLTALSNHLTPGPFLPLFAPVPPCLISEFFTQILLVVSNDIKEKLGKKKRSRFRPNDFENCQNVNETVLGYLGVTRLLKCSLYSLYGYLWTPFRRDFPSYRRFSTKSSQHNKNCLLAITISELEQPRGRRRKPGNQKQQV